jgi:hypothetical protein
MCFSSWQPMYTFRSKVDGLKRLKVGGCGHSSIACCLHTCCLCVEKLLRAQLSVVQGIQWIGLFEVLLVCRGCLLGIARW